MDLLNNYVLEDSQKWDLHFLMLPFDRKLKIVKSYIINSNGVTESELIAHTKKIIKHIQNSFDRELETVPDRTKLSYRNYANISGRR